MIDKIQDICRLRGMSITDLSKALNITTQAFYTSVSRNPTLNRIKEIANILGVEPHELLTPLTKDGDTEHTIRFHFQCSCGKVHTITID